MDKQFSFRIKVKGVYGNYSFYAPVENGFVITNSYCPKELIVGESSILSQIAIPRNGETEAEFLQDCNNILERANACDDNDVYYCIGQATTSVIVDHIKRCGRLLFMDLLIYMDCFAYLLKAVGYSDSEIKKSYPVLVKGFVDNAGEIVKESRTLLPLKQTEYYNILCKLANN